MEFFLTTEVIILVDFVTRQHTAAACASVVVILRFRFWNSHQSPPVCFTVFIINFMQTLFRLINCRAKKDFFCLPKRGAVFNVLQLFTNTMFLIFYYCGWTWFLT